MKVLIVDDDALICECFQRAVESAGHETRTAENGRDGLEVCEQFRPELVLCDIEMPVMTGLEMLEAIRQRHLDPIVVIMTAHGSEKYVMQALHLGANNYLKKPLALSDLFLLLQKYSSLVASRTLQQEILGMVVRREFTMQFDSRVQLVPRIADYLAGQAGGILDEDERVSVDLGLYELLLNSVEHGNLAISYDEKSAALAAGNLEALYEERVSDPVLSKRKVTVDFRQNHESCEWRISDEGRGFDWRSLPQKLQSDGLERPNGRGVLISRFLFDEFEYLGTGSVVRVKKAKRGKAGGMRSAE